MLKIIENKSAGYAQRTYANARKGDVTAAIGIDYSTAGERLTKKASGDRYIALPISIELLIQPTRVHGQALAKFMRSKTRSGKPCLNIAGNGIFTLSRHGLDQARVNQYIYEVLAVAHQHFPIGTIISGGQTGADIAGVVAAQALGIPAIIHMPHKFIQRYEDGKDITRNPNDIRIEVMNMAKHLKGIVYTAEETTIEKPEQHTHSAVFRHAPRF